MEKKKTINPKPSWHPFPRYILRKSLVLDIVKDLLKKDKNIRRGLEIGYGSGDMLISLARLGLRVDGYEISDEAKTLALSLINKNKKEIKKRIKLLESLPKNKKYDIIFAFEVLEHIKNDLQALNSWASLLKEGGYLLISVPGKMSSWSSADVYAGHYRRYEKEELIDKLSKTHLKIIKFYNYGFPLTYITDRLRRIQLEKFFGGYKDIKNNKTLLTKKSGVIRTTNKIFIFLSNNFFLYPFIQIQKLFLYTNLGNSFLCLARKK